MGFYDNMAALATRQLADKGEDVVFTRVVNSPYDALTGKTDTKTQVTAKGLVVDYKHWQIDGQSVLAGDKRLYVAGPSLPFTPDPTSDKVSISGVSHSIVRASKPVNQNVLWDLQVRRG